MLGSRGGRDAESEARRESTRDWVCGSWRVPAPCELLEAGAMLGNAAGAGAGARVGVGARASAPITLFICCCRRSRRTLFRLVGPRRRLRRS
jgi:hypothetical protein